MRIGSCMCECVCVCDNINDEEDDDDDEARERKVSTDFSVHQRSSSSSFPVTHPVDGDSSHLMSFLCVFFSFAPTTTTTYLP